MPSKAPTLSVSYKLRPPSSASTPGNLSATTTHDIPLQFASELGLHSDPYYVALRDAIAEAKDITGRELTEWRDAVGEGEKEKTGGTAADVSEEAGLEEEEGEGTEVKER